MLDSICSMCPVAFRASIFSGSLRTLLFWICRIYSAYTAAAALKCCMHQRTHACARAHVCLCSYRCLTGFTLPRMHERAQPPDEKGRRNPLIPVEHMRAMLEECRSKPVG